MFLGGASGSSGGPLVRTLRAHLGARFVLIGANPFSLVDFVFEHSRGAARWMYLSDPGMPNDRLGAPGQRFLRGFAATEPDAVGGFVVLAAAATGTAGVQCIA